MGFFVRFWGVRGSIPTPGWQTRRYGGNTTCVEVRVNDTLFILDGGTGLRELGDTLIKRGQFPITAHMLFSHPHWDHIQGFPFFTPAYMPNNTLYIYGRDKKDKSYFELLSGQMKSDYFPVEFADLGAHLEPKALDEQGTQIGDAKVSWFKQVHPGGSLAYRIEHDGYAIAFCTDNELDLSLRNKERVDRDPRSHREVSPDFIDFVSGVDLLIADGQYTEDEYPTKIGWGHARAQTVVDAAIDAHVKRLAITHHDPMQSDDQVDEKILRCRKRAEAQHADLIIFGAREKVELRIDDGEPQGAKMLPED